MMKFIKKITSISHQDSFGKGNLWGYELLPLEKDAQLISPNYKEYIPAIALRRLSTVLRMSLTCALYCQSSVKEEFEAITVGTALGCLKDTEKFLTSIHTVTGDTLPPTAFIQSTHNTIGGQISLALKNHAYNMTHTQNSISFEMALIDALVCNDEGCRNVLTGAADEAIDFLKLLQPDVIKTNLQLTSGATFLAIGDSGNERRVKILDCKTFTDYKQVSEKIDTFLQAQQIESDSIDCAFVTHQQLAGKFRKALLYPLYSGLYYTSSAFALHMAHDWLLKNNKKYALVVNEQVKGTLGLILLALDNEA